MSVTSARASMTATPPRVGPRHRAIEGLRHAVSCVCLLLGAVVASAEGYAANYYGPPFTIPSYMWDNPRFSSIGALDAAAWSTYRSIWTPARYPNCGRVVTPSANGRETNFFGNWCVTGQCGGCGSIVGTAYQRNVSMP